MIDIIVILAIYLLLMLGIGFYSRRYIKNIDDYLVAGRRLGIVFLSATLAATHYGGGFVLGGGAWGVSYGIGGIWYGLACGVGLIVLGLFLAEKTRALAQYTVPDLIDLRYNSKFLRLSSSLLSLAALTGIIGAQVWAMTAVFEALGLPGYYGAIIATLVFIVYTAASGLWAVTITDLGQIVIGSIGVLVATIAGLITVGGFAGLSNRLSIIAKDIGVTPSTYYDLFSPGLTVIALTLSATVMYTLIGQDFYQRLFAAKTPSIARKAAIVAGILLVVLSFLPVLAGMTALALASDPNEVLNSPKTAIPRLILQIFPGWGAGIFLAAILAAIMSTADSLLSASTSHIIRDIYVQFINPNADNKKLIKLSIITTIIVGILALVVAILVKDIILLLIYSYDIYTSAVFVPVILGLFWSKATKEGAIAALVSGATISLLGITNIIKLPYWEEIYLLSAAISLVIMIVVSILTYKETKE
ncbi:sodium:solute symporter family protein [Desulfurococcaceae archaeon MEX13E-LK6-19]|nr:sodium:solute symporter family protein [Desulfurococcaceae archaeon MEX13E-LK6-19]